MGELLFWYAAADAVYLGGATVEGVGGHNPVEPAQLGKRVFTGPYGFNFRETFEALEKADALKIGTSANELADWWLAEIESTQPMPVLGSFFSVAQAPLEQTLGAVLAMLPKAPAHA
jgi:3-deoxy-D-manno-octulosonic-acid transferase